jgi:hypothetical protein
MLAEKVGPGAYAPLPPRGNALSCLSQQSVTPSVGADALARPDQGVRAYVSQGGLSVHPVKPSASQLPRMALQAIQRSILRSSVPPWEWPSAVHADYSRVRM